VNDNKNITIHKGVIIMSYGVVMGKKVYCPKCNRMYENPKITYIIDKKYYCFCYCGHYFEIYQD